MLPAMAIQTLGRPEAKTGAGAGEDRGREQTEGVVGKSVCSTPKRRVL